MMSHEGSFLSSGEVESSCHPHSNSVLIKKKSKASRHPKAYHCPTCGRSFTTKGNLEFHINSIHLRVTAYGCDICSKVFAQAGNLKTHKENVHNKLKRFRCVFCPKAFSQKTALQNHHFNVHIQMQQHHQQTAAHSQVQQQQTFHPPAQIEIVQNPLLVDPNAVQHIIQTSSGATTATIGGKPKRKNFIPLQTISETDLIRQGVQVIQAPPQQVTVTALDGTPGGTPVDLGIYHHPQPSSSSKLNKKKKHACTLCDKAFAQIINLRTHVTTVHEGKKNYPCPECDKNFTQKGNLKAHITTIHQKLKNFQCVYCHKLFSQKGNMKTHIKNTHS